MKNNKNLNKKKNSPTKVISAVAGIIAVVCVIGLFAIGATGGFEKLGFSSDSDTVLTSQTATGKTTANENGELAVAQGKNEEDKKMTEENVKVLVEMEDGGEFVLELYPSYAPQTVQNFVDLVSDGFYDGVGFHRVVDGFMAQGGDPEGTGMGGSGVQIPGEFSSNGFSQNTLSHQRGVISMARSMDPDSASSQFFICYDDASFLDGQYAAFGKVIEGMDVVDGFLDVERKPNSMGEMAIPVTPITMKKVTIIED